MRLLRTVLIAAVLLGAGLGGAAMAVVAVGRSPAAAAPSAPVPTVVQSAKARCLLSGDTVTLGQPVAAGHTLDIIVGGNSFNGPAPTTVSVSDPVNGAWTRLGNTGSLISSDRLHDLSLAVYQVTNAKAAPSGLRIRISVNENLYYGAPDAVAFEVNGTLDSFKMNTAIQSSYPMTGPSAPAGDLAVGAFTDYSNAGIGAGAGWTTVQNASSCSSTMAESQLLSTQAWPTTTDRHLYLAATLGFTAGGSGSSSSSSSSSSTTSTSSTSTSTSSTTTPTTTSTTTPTTSTTTPTTTTSTTPTTSTTTPTTTTSTTPTTTTTTSTTTSTTTPPPPTGLQSAGWWPAWETNAPMSSIPWNALTQIIMFSDTSMASAPWLNTSTHGMTQAGQQQIVSLAHQHKDTAILSIGGSDDQNWSTACNATNRAAFINAAIGQMHQYGYDGIELDIEQGPWVGTADFNACVKAFHDMVKATTTSTGGVPLVTLDSDPSWEAPQTAPVAQYLDQINMMGYNETCASNCAAVATAIAQYTSRGVPASKLLDGIGLDPGMPDATNAADCGAKALWISSHNAAAGVMEWSVQDDYPGYACMTGLAPYVSGAGGSSSSSSTTTTSTTPTTSSTTSTTPTTSSTTSTTPTTSSTTSTTPTTTSTSSTTSTTTTSPPPTGGLRVSANQLQDVAGSTVRLHGVDRSGSEYACVQGWGIFDGPNVMNDDSQIPLMKNWHANEVLIGLNEDCWLAINGVPAAYAGQNYINAIKHEVATAESAGLYPVLSLFWGAPGSTVANGQEPMNDNDHAPAFWKSVASTFKGDPNVVLRLKEEPYPAGNSDTAAAWACWSQGDVQYDTSNTLTPISRISHCSESYPTVGMQSLVNIVRGTGATNVIALPGIQYANTMTHFLDAGVRVSDALNPPQLMGVADVYPNGNICNSTSCYDSEYGPVASAMPFMFGEFGESVDGSDCSTGGVNAIMSWADAHGAGYSGWSWDTWGGCLQMISDYTTGNPNGNWGTAYKNHLASLP